MAVSAVLATTNLTAVLAMGGNLIQRNKAAGKVIVTCTPDPSSRLQIVAFPP
jgi:hypothetical protein